MTIRPILRVLVAAALGGTLVACSPDDDSPEKAAPTTPSVSTDPAPPPTPPARGRCFQLTYRGALAATSHTGPVPCRGRHTATTFFVGDLDLIADGHLLSPDSERARAQVAAACPKHLGGYLGATDEQLRLSSLRSVWFVPTVEESTLGAAWFRCDVVALAGPQRLAPLRPGPAKGLLGTPEGREAFALCGTAEPGSAAFRRVICSARHAWRAIASYDVSGTKYPRVPALREAAQDTCQAAAQRLAEDSLSFQWGYDWPTADQWRQGQHYGLCWAPEPT